MAGRPEATNTGVWVDAEDPIDGTCAQVACILEMTLELHRARLDQGERIMLGQVIELLELLGDRADTPLDG